MEYNPIEKLQNAYYLKLSNLRKTWIIDIDGTLVVHNGYKENGNDTILEGVMSFIKQINEEDIIILLSARELKYKELTEKFLRKHDIRYDYLICGIPTGERILINDKKPSGLLTAYALNVDRNDFPKIIFSELKE